MKNNTVFVLLAGGKSQRMGLAKGLLHYHDTFWILEQLNRISEANIDTVYIGLGHYFQHYLDSIPWFQQALNNIVSYLGMAVKIIINPDPDLGSFSTLQSVFKQLESPANVLVNPIDVPILNAVELNKIIARQNTVVFPCFNSKAGHPIKLGAQFWQPLVTLNSADPNARLDFQVRKVNQSNISRVTVDDSDVVKNLNTKREWFDFLDESLVVEKLIN